MTQPNPPASTPGHPAQDTAAVSTGGRAQDAGAAVYWRRRLARPVWGSTGSGWRRRRLGWAGSRGGTG
jgi:hypothetical protein